MRALTVGAVIVASMSLLSCLSSASVPFHADASARLRLSFSARPQRIEVCRKLTDEEMEKVAEHMRQRESCEGAFATYTLRIDEDGRRIGESIVRGAGLRNDRPLYLLREYPITPGQHRIRVALTQREKHIDATEQRETAHTDADTGRYAGRAQREAFEHARRSQAAIPAQLTLDTVLLLAPRQVALVTFDVERRVLTLRASPHQ